MPRPSAEDGGGGPHPQGRLDLALPELPGMPPATAPVSEPPTQEPELSRADQRRMEFILSLRARGMADVAVLRALETIPRENFVPHRLSDLAWRDMALPIACGQTMPSALTAARMMSALALEPHHRVLEIGAGSGYCTSILSRLAGEIVSCERYRTLAHSARARIEGLAASNVTVHWRDGLDLPENSGTFDRILIDAAIGDIPRDLFAALRPGGIMAYGRQGEGSSAGFFIMRKSSAGAAEEFQFAARFAEALRGRSQEL